MSKLCGHKLWAAGRAGGAEVHNPKQEPQNKMWEKRNIAEVLHLYRCYTHTWQVHLKQATIAASVSRWSAISAHAAMHAFASSLLLLAPLMGGRPSSVTLCRTPAHPLWHPVLAHHPRASELFVGLSVDLPVDFAPNNSIKIKKQAHLVTGQYKSCPKFAHRTFAAEKKSFHTQIPRFMDA